VKANWAEPQAELLQVIVSIGQSWTRSSACQPPRNIWNYDEVRDFSILMCINPSPRFIT